MRGPLDYLLSAPGKDFRRQLIGAFNRSLQVPADKLVVINNIVELLHTASLLYEKGSASILIKLLMKSPHIGSMIFKMTQNSDEAFLLRTKFMVSHKPSIQQTMHTF